MRFVIRTDALHDDRGCSLQLAVLRVMCLVMNCMLVALARSFECKRLAAPFGCIDSSGKRPCRDV